MLPSLRIVLERGVFGDRLQMQFLRKASYTNVRRQFTKRLITKGESPFQIFNIPRQTSLIPHRSPRRMLRRQGIPKRPTFSKTG